VWREEEEDGYDVYVDSLHNLPDNCAIVKIKAKIVSTKNVVQLRETELWPKVQVSTFMKQIYNEKLEVRDTVTDPTSMLQLTFITLDTTQLKLKTLGYSFFPLFINTETQMPVVQLDHRMNMNKIKRALHKGAYQMPIYYQAPQHKDLVSYQDYIRLERIPTASVLLRVDYASIDYEGNFISIKD
jgi:hypothetical protein